MQTTSYSCPRTVGHTVGWHRATRWIVSVVCGLLLALVAASPAHASSVTSSSAPIDRAAAAAADSATPDRTALDRAPVRHSGSHDPFDSSDVWLDPDNDRDDDDSLREHVSSGSDYLSAEELLGLTRASLEPGGSLVPDHTPGNPFLAESARRL
jgi:hypothetical protein